MVTSDPANISEREDYTQVLANSQGTPVNPATEDTIRPDAVDTVFDTAVGANTDILSSAVVPTASPAIFRVTVALDTAVVFNAQVTRGGNTVEYDFNQGNALDAGSVFQFDHPVRDASSINYQVETGATVLVLNVDEIQATGP